jgi:hypothetical protein
MCGPQRLVQLTEAWVDEKLEPDQAPGHRARLPVRSAKPVRTFKGLVV